MMKILRKNLKVIIAFTLGLILAGGIVYAATNASQVTYTTSKNDAISNVAQALNDLYSKKQADDSEWVEIEGAFVTEPNYSLSAARLYRKGNLCKISFTEDNITKDTAYSLITDSRYYPKEQIEVYGFGTGYGTASVTLKTDGTFVVTSQTQSWNHGWASIKNIIYPIND